MGDSNLKELALPWKERRPCSKESRFIDEYLRQPTVRSRHIGNRFETCRAVFGAVTSSTEVLSVHPRPRRNGGVRGPPDVGRAAAASCRDARAGRALRLAEARRLAVSFVMRAGRVLSLDNEQRRRAELSLRAAPRVDARRGSGED
jgi:hypothetical protein